MKFCNADGLVGGERNMEYGHVMLNVKKIPPSMKAVICTVDVSQLAAWPWLQSNIKYAAVTELQLAGNETPPHYPFLCRQAQKEEKKKKQKRKIKKAELNVQFT